MKRVVQFLKQNAINARGWRTKRKIVVIESDDWGTIRMPSARVLNELGKLGIETAGDHYIQNDALASETDLTRLFDLLSARTDRHGTHPKITANAIMANPDFDKIREAEFSAYHYEPFTETLKRYPEHSNSFNLWRKGEKKGLFIPQFHGREHLHIQRWLDGLQNRGSETATLFDHRLYALCSGSTAENRKSYMAAWEWDNERDREYTTEAVRMGLKMFEEIFGYPSLSAIAPNYTWNREMEEVFFNGGVKYIQGSTVQRSPEITKNENTLVRHYTGEENELGQIYMVRNCRFEPASDPEKDWVDSCLSEIEASFRWRKPAIIESHRVNYIGYINSANREKNLELLGDLIDRILSKWPGVEFMSSDQLGRLIEETS